MTRSKQKARRRKQEIEAEIKAEEDQIPRTYDAEARKI
jgi:hypothetical protein